MPATVIVNQLTVVHKDSGGTVSFMPDVCLTPSSAGPIPIPYPNLATSQDTAQGSPTVSCDGNPAMIQGSVFSKSTGDEAGSNGGVVSATTKGAAQFINYSFDVTFDGKPVARLGDLMLGNKGGTFNTPPAPEVQPPAVVVPPQAAQDKPEDFTFVAKDRAGKPLKDISFVLVLPTGEKIEGKTDGQGKGKASGTVVGLCRLTFPDHPGATHEG
jgi:uncharacterized Zn-binding protein involved in type VI secretion